MMHLGGFHYAASPGPWICQPLPEEFAPRVFGDAAQLAIVQLATAQLMFQHVEERRTLVCWDQSEDVFDLVLLLVGQHDV